MPLINQTFSQLITFTRASGATYFDASGVLQTAATNVPRFDYDPSTLAARGLLIEESRTNSIRNNTMVGAVAGTPGTLPQVSGSPSWSASSAGGVSREVVGVGSINGINYIDIRVSTPPTGTTNTNLALNLYFELATQIAALTGQTWSESVWVQMVGGSTAGIGQIFLAMVEISSGGADLAYLSGTDFKSTIGTFTRRTYTVTTSNASTAFIRPALWVSTTGIGAVIDITLRIGLPQLELGAFATSVIPTTTTALTRSADVASVNTLSPWYNATSGTLYAEVQHYAPSAAVQQWQAQLASGSGDYYGIYKESSPANITTRVRSGGADQAFAYTTGAISANTTYKTALGYAVNDVASCTNGGTVFTDATVTLPTSITALGLGQPTYTTAVMLNGYLRRIVYYPRRLSNAELQSITS